MSKRTKRPGQPHSRAKRKQKQQIDWSAELRQAYGQMKQNKKNVESGSMYAAQYRRPQRPSGRSDGRWI